MLREWRLSATVVALTGLALLGLPLTSVFGQAPTGAMDSMANAYRAASGAWLSRLTGVAQRTFGILAAIEFALSALWYAVRRDALEEMAMRLLLKFILLSFMLAVILSFSYWVPTIMDGFAAAGEYAIGSVTVSPSSVIDIGVSTAGRVLGVLNGWNIVTNPTMAMFAALSALIILIAYVVIAAMILLVLIESFIVLGAGPLFVCFAGSRFTAAYAENFFNYAVNVGVQILLLYLLVGLGSSIARSMIPVIRADTFISSDLRPLGQVVGYAVSFALVAVRVPTKVAARITSTHSFGLANALRGV